MTNTELERKVKQLQQLKESYKQLEQVIEDLKDEIKDEMTRRKINTLEGTTWKIIWREQTYTRLNKELLEKDFGDLSKYEKVTKNKYFYLKDK